MSGEYIFTMQSLIKRYGRNEVLNGINLCFYHGAKIGIVGANGSAAKGASNLQTHHLSGADQTVPEPTSMAVMALGGVLLLRLNRQVA